MKTLPLITAVIYLHASLQETAETRCPVLTSIHNTTQHIRGVGSCFKLDPQSNFTARAGEGSTDALWMLASLKCPPLLINAARHAYPYQMKSKLYSPRPSSPSSGLVQM